MSAHAKAKPISTRHDATRWRRFLTKSPSLEDLIEIRRVHHTKTVLRQRGELPPAVAFRRGAWRHH